MTRLCIRKSKLTELLSFEPFGIEAGKSYPLSTILNLLQPTSWQHKQVILGKRDHRARIIIPVYSLPGWTFYWAQDVNRHGEVAGIGFFSAYKRKKAT